MQNYLIEIILSVATAAALGFCKYLEKQLKTYKSLLDDQEEEKTECLIEEKIEPIFEEMEELRQYIRKMEIKEKSDLDLIISSYKFRLVQLCKQFIKQGYMTQDQYDQLTEFFKLYSALGGNGQAKKYYERACELEIKDGEFLSSK